MPDKPKPQAVPALNLSWSGTAKGKERGDLQTDKEVISYLEQIDIANRAAKNSEPFRRVVSMGRRAEATLVKIIKNHELQGTR